MLAAAGRLKGGRAATHWAYVDLLPLVGGHPREARVVREGNRFTAGGVTAGIDFALSIVAELVGREVRKPFGSGSSTTPALPSTAVISTRGRLRRRPAPDPVSVAGGARP